MDEFELEDNLEFILQSIQELMEDQGENNAFSDANQNELFASLVNYDHVRSRIGCLRVRSEFLWGSRFRCFCWGGF